jgi:hypothetical protein
VDIPLDIPTGGLQLALGCSGGEEPKAKEDVRAQPDPHDQRAGRLSLNTRMALSPFFPTHFNHEGGVADEIPGKALKPVLVVMGWNMNVGLL